MSLFDDALFEAKALTRRRRAGGGYDDNGEYTGAENDDASIKGSIQPASATMLGRLPEGLRTDTKAVLYTGAGLVEDDRVIDGDNTYRVIDIEDWRHHGGFLKAFLGAINEQP